MRDVVKNYLALAGGLVEAGKDKAVGVSQTVVMQGLTLVTKATGAVEDVREQTKQNTEAVAALVKYEATRALGRVGLVAANEVTVLQTRVADLESAARKQEAALAAAQAPTAAQVPTPAQAPTAAQALTRAQTSTAAQAPTAVAAKRAPARKRLAVVPADAPTP